MYAGHNPWWDWWQSILILDPIIQAENQNELQIIKADCLKEIDLSIFERARSIEVGSYSYLRKADILYIRIVTRWDRGWQLEWWRSSFDNILYDMKYSTSSIQVLIWYEYDYDLTVYLMNCISCDLFCIWPIESHYIILMVKYSYLLNF